MIGLGLLTLGSDILVPQASLAQRMPGAPAVSAPLVENSQPRSTPVVATPELSPQPVNEPYVLGQGDRIKVTIFRAPDYSGDYDARSSPSA